MYVDELFVYAKTHSRYVQASKRGKEESRSPQEYAPPDHRMWDVVR